VHLSQKNLTYGDNSFNENQLQPAGGGSTTLGGETAISGGGTPDTGCGMPCSG